MSEGLAMFAGALAMGLESIVTKDWKSLHVEGPLLDILLGTGSGSVNRISDAIQISFACARQASCV